MDASDFISVDEEGDATFYIPTVDLASYGVGCSFKTPVSLAAIWDDNKDDETAETAKPNNDDGDADLEMTINAGISGKLQEMVQVFAIEHEDGTEETREVFVQPAAIVTTNC